MKRLLVAIALLLVVLGIILAFPRNDPQPVIPLSIGAQALPGRIIRYEPERVGRKDASPVHPGRRADAIEVGSSWDAAMLTVGGEDFVDTEERRRRELRHADLASVRGPVDAGFRHPTVERRFRGLIELRLRGEDYAIGTGRILIDGESNDHMVTTFVRRPQGWMVTEDLAGSEVMRVVAAVQAPATEPNGKESTAYDPELVDKPWPTDTAALVAECAQWFAQDHWLKRVALNRLCSPTHLPGLEAALSGPHAITAARALLAMNVGESFEALMRSAASIPEDDRAQVLAICNTTWFDAAMLAHVRRHAEGPADRLLLGAVTGTLARCGTVEDLEDLTVRARAGTFDAAQIEALGTGLRSLQPVAAHTPALEALVAWWSRPDVTGVALLHVGTLGGTEAMLAALLQADLPNRPGQAEVLAHMLTILMPQVAKRHPDTTAQLLPHLTHAEPVVRWLAAEMLMASDDAVAHAAVAEQAAHEPTELVRQRLVTLTTAAAAMP